MNSSEIEKSHSEQRLPLQLSRITKSFPGIVANDSVDFTLRKERFTQYWVKMVQVNQL